MNNSNAFGRWNGANYLGEQKKGAKVTATDQLVNIIKRSKKGVDAPTLMKKTGLAERTVRNMLFRAGKQAKINRAGRGVYVGA